MPRIRLTGSFLTLACVLATANAAAAACQPNDAACLAKESELPSSFGGTPAWATPAGAPKRQSRSSGAIGGRAGGPEATDKAAPQNTERSSGGPSFVDGACKGGKASARAAVFSFDGKSIDGPGDPTVGDSQVCTDRMLKKADIQVRYDGFTSEPTLNVVATPERGSGKLRFETYTNYATSLERGEIRIFDPESSIKGQPVAVVPLKGENAEWAPPRSGPDRYAYVLRVYDRASRFDETTPKTVDLAGDTGAARGPDPVLRVDTNARYVKNIPIAGGTIVVSGNDLRPGEKVTVLGQPVVVGPSGAFAFKQILPSGEHEIDIAVTEPNGRATVYSRSASIPTHDLFYVGLAEVTVGNNNAKGPVGLVAPDQADNFKGRYFVDGRLALYLKGKIRGDTLITASADTRDQPVKRLFSNFASKDPTYLLRNLDPNRYYPVYGDDSTLIEDAPTRGKFYIRVENGDSSATWGNFKTTITGTEFVRYDRGLYGARLQSKTPDSTKFGERRGAIEGFAAEPGTVGVRDVFLGTGGSSYFLSHQNVTQGSERVSIEVRDRVTGVVLESKFLSPTQDYSINYIQGRINLNSTLGSTGPSDFIVQSSGFGGTYRYVVVHYEHAPGLLPVRDRVIGGRASYWLSDHFQVAVTGYDQRGAGEKLRIGGADVTARLTPQTYIKAEVARTNGTGASENLSIDGGFTFNERRSAGGPAWARRIEGAADLADFIPGAQGRVAAFWKHKQANYSGPGEITTINTGATKDFGARGDMRFGDSWAARVKLDGHTDSYRRYYAGEANVSYTFNPNWRVTAGVRADQNNVLQRTASPDLNYAGSRVDAALRLDYTRDRLWGVYGFVQATVWRTLERQRNNRIGVGGYARLNDRLIASAEVSTGDRGLGAKVGAEYKTGEDRTSYINYALDPDRTDIIDRGGLGQLTAGSRQRFSDDASVFAETRNRYGGGFSGLMHAFGLEFSPYKNWRTGVRGEIGRLTDPISGSVKRVAVSPNLSYSHDGISYNGRFEYRRDETTTALAASTASQTRTTYLMANSFTAKINPDWRFLGRLNGSYSSSTQGDFYRGNYLEAIAGFAYRPVHNDKLNVLFKYTYFYNVPSPGQTAFVAGLNDYAQQSHVLSADAIYDLNQWISIGGKVGLRHGSIRDNHLNGPWYSSTALLTIGRVDFHVVKQWDVTAELRRLSLLHGGNSQTGALIALYRHMNDNFRIGAGYNFTRFSDDLTNLSTRNRGFFINAIGMF